MQKFPKNTLHVNANDRNRCLGCVGVHEMQYKLNKLDSQVFPLLADDTIPISNCSSRSWDLNQVFEKAKLNKVNPDGGKMKNFIEETSSFTYRFPSHLFTCTTGQQFSDHFRR